MFYGMDSGNQFPRFWTKFDRRLEIRFYAVMKIFRFTYVNYFLSVVFE